MVTTSTPSRSNQRMKRSGYPSCCLRHDVNELHEKNCTRFADQSSYVIQLSGKSTTQYKKLVINWSRILLSTEDPAPTCLHAGPMVFIMLMCIMFILSDHRMLLSCNVSIFDLNPSEVPSSCYSLRYIIRTPVRIIYYRTYQFPLTRIFRSRFISDHWFVSLCLKTAVLVV